MDSRSSDICHNSQVNARHQARSVLDEASAQTWGAHILKCSALHVHVLEDLSCGHACTLLKLI